MDPFHYRLYMEEKYVVLYLAMFNFIYFYFNSLNNKCNLLTSSIIQAASLVVTEFFEQGDRERALLNIQPQVSVSNVYINEQSPSLFKWNMLSIKI